MSDRNAQGFPQSTADPLPTPRGLASPFTGHVPAKWHKSALLSVRQEEHTFSENSSWTLLAQNKRPFREAVCLYEVNEGSSLGTAGSGRSPHSILSQRQAGGADERGKGRSSVAGGMAAGAET